MSLLGGERDGLASVAPARPFECLRVSGPSQGNHEGLPLRVGVPAPPRGMDSGSRRPE